MIINRFESSRKDNIMSSSVGVTEQSFGNGPPQVSPPAFEGDSRGGAVKPSQILGSIGTGLGAAAALAPITAPITIPLGIITGLAGSIASLFGGGLTQQEVDMLNQIKTRVDQRRDLRGTTGNPAS